MSFVTHSQNCGLKSRQPKFSHFFVMSTMYTKMYQELRNFITFFPSFFQVWTILQRRTKSKVLMLLQMLEPWMKFFKMILNITNSILVLHTNQNLVLYVPFYTTNPVTNIQTSRICTKHKKQ